MNERIRELAEKALDQAVPETWSTLTCEQLGRFQEKFAELIVKECVEVNRQHNFFERGWIAMYENFGMNPTEIFEKKNDRKIN